MKVGWLSPKSMNRFVSVIRSTEKGNAIQVNESHSATSRLCTDTGKSKKTDITNESENPISFPAFHVQL